jgi:hypothetical protein
MSKISVKHIGLLVCVMLGFSLTGFSQKYEVHPLVGTTLPLKWADLYSLKSSTVFGVKGAFSVTKDTQVEGEFEYMPKFEFRGTDPKIRGYIWGVNINRNFTVPRHKAVPFYTFGVGAVTSHVSGASSATMVLTDRSIRIDSGDTFLSMNYGVGVKALRVWGPVGLRANIYGRTLPNYFGRANSWAEITGGFVFAFGD